MSWFLVLGSEALCGSAVSGSEGEFPNASYYKRAASRTDARAENFPFRWEGENRICRSEYVGRRPFR
jgi:hypothetical protein